MSYYQLSKEIKDEIKLLLSSFSTSQLMTKEAYKGNIQQVILSGSLVELKIYYNRLYPNMYVSRTNSNGDTFIDIKVNDDFITYKLNDLLYLISWKDESCIMRIIIPSNLLSNDLIKYFTAKIIQQGNFTESTDTEQIAYFNEMDGGDVLLTTYPQIQIENKEI